MSEYAHQILKYKIPNLRLHLQLWLRGPKFFHLHLRLRLQPKKSPSVHRCWQESNMGDFFSETCSSISTSNWYSTVRHIIELPLMVAAMMKTRRDVMLWPMYEGNLTSGWLIIFPDPFFVASSAVASFATLILRAYRRMATQCLLTCELIKRSDNAGLSNKLTWKIWINTVIKMIVV